MPPLPVDVPHHSSVLQTRQIAGVAAIQYSSGATPAGSLLALAPAAGAPAIEWGIWRYIPAPDETLLSVSFDLDIAGASAWIGVANYAEQRWELRGPFPQAGPAALGGLGTEHVSPGGNTYFVVAAFSGTAIDVQQLAVAVDEAAPATFVISGSVEDSVTGLGIVSAELTLTPGNLHATTVQNGVFVFSGLAPGTYTITSPSVPGYTVTPPSNQATLGPNALDVHFLAAPISTDITYTNKIKALFDNKCIHCHGATVQQGGVRLDRYLAGDGNDAFHHAEAAYSRVSGDMCPWGETPLNISQKQLLDDWIDVYNKAE